MLILLFQEYFPMSWFVDCKCLQYKSLSLSRCRMREHCLEKRVASGTIMFQLFWEWLEHKLQMVVLPTSSTGSSKSPPAQTFSKAHPKWSGVWTSDIFLWKLWVSDVSGFETNAVHWLEFSCFQKEGEPGGWQVTAARHCCLVLGRWRTTGQGRRKSAKNLLSCISVLAVPHTFLQLKEFGFAFFGLVRLHDLIEGGMLASLQRCIMWTQRCG